MSIQKTQKEIFSEVLKALSKDVTSNDKNLAAQTLGIKSMTTIGIYLNGEGKKNDIAAALIAFFKERIANRNKVLV